MTSSPKEIIDESDLALLAFFFNDNIEEDLIENKMEEIKTKEEFCAQVATTIYELKQIQKHTDTMIVLCHSAQYSNHNIKCDDNNLSQKSLNSLKQSISINNNIEDLKLQKIQSDFKEVNTINLEKFNQLSSVFDEIWSDNSCTSYQIMVCQGVGRVVDGTWDHYDC